VYLRTAIGHYSEKQHSFCLSNPDERKQRKIMKIRLKSRSYSLIATGVFELVCLVAGATLPLARITEFWIFENEFSILSLFNTLLSSGEILLAVIVFGFGFLFPLSKITTSFFEGLGSIPATIQRFSMVDVFLLSFLVYGSKISESYDMALGAGFYFLCAALALGFARSSFCERGNS
jgi:uncharacterized paraquat-inducible protein A